MHRRCSPSLVLSLLFGVALVLPRRDEKKQHATAIYSGCLMALIALERLTYKLMVDRMAPFR